MVHFILETAVFYALASNMLFMLPWYQTFIRSKKYRKVYRDEGKVFENGSMLRPEEKKEIVWQDKAPFNFVGYKFYTLQESNLFARKPFTCIYCTTFWLSLSTPIFFNSFSLTVAMVTICTAFIAPVIAVLLDKVIKALPTNF